MRRDVSRRRSRWLTPLRALMSALILTLIAAAPAAAGQVYGWGFNWSEQLSNGKSTENSRTPTPVDSLTEVSAISAGGNQGYAITSTGPVAWGNNNYAQLDLNAYPGPETCPLGNYCGKTPAPMFGLEDATQVAAGGDHGLALLASGKVLAWGENERGQLGDGTMTGPESCKASGFTNYCSVKPLEVPGVSGAVSVAAGGADSFAVLSDGSVMAWGSDFSGQLGDGGTTARDEPFRIPGLIGVKAIAPGKGEFESGITLALLNTGKVKMWGYSSKVPTEVSGLSGTTAVAAGASFGLALLENGHVMTFTSPTSAKEVPGLSGVTAIAAGENQSFAVLASGRVMGWGTGVSGSLGNGGTESPEPSGVCGLTGVTQISSGGNFTYAYSPNLETIPEVMEISPSGGPPFGGTKVKITGLHFEGATSVKFGSTEATSFTVGSDTSIEATAPPGEGTVPVTVTSPDGTSVTCNGDRYRNTPPPTVTKVRPRVAAAGNSVTITGTDLGETVAVDFGSTPAASYTVNSATSITAMAPSGLLGTVDVTVTTTEGTSATSSADRVTLLSPPEYGRCFKGFEGAFGGSTCVSGSSFNKYEWLPGFGGSSPLLKTGFAAVIKPLTKLSLVTSGNHTITCTGATGIGSFTGAKATSLSLKLTGCAYGEISCQSAEAETGEVRSAPLATELGVVKAGTEARKNQIGTDMHPVSGETIATFTCGSTPVVVTGSTIAIITGVNAMSTKETVRFATGKSVQKPLHFEGGPEDVLHATIGAGAPERTGLSLILTQTSEEKVELSTVI
ncbi:MAG: chromosome condensation regulator [Solirubrobacterales bacterium]|nr:chromosome condensation regulator [Solirubrobacterales bacterium]